MQTHQIGRPNVGYLACGVNPCCILFGSAAQGTLPQHLNWKFVKQQHTPTSVKTSMRIETSTVSHLLQPSVATMFDDND